MLVAGFDAPSTRNPSFTHPEGLIAELERECGPYILHASVVTTTRRPDTTIASSTRRSRPRSPGFVPRCTCCGRGTWDVAMYMIKSTDQVAHHSWDYGAPTAGTPPAGVRPRRPDALPIPGGRGTRLQRDRDVRSRHGVAAARRGVSQRDPRAARVPPPWGIDRRRGPLASAAPRKAPRAAGARVPEAPAAQRLPRGSATRSASAGSTGRTRARSATTRAAACGSTWRAATRTASSTPTSARPS